MKGLRSCFTYGALDQIASRGFDFITLWILMRTLPVADLANYGIASGMLFVLNALLVTPETALIRDKVAWSRNQALTKHLNSFLLFGEMRIALILLLMVTSAFTAGLSSPYTIACALALINQFVQLAEIPRLDFRIDLQQRAVFLPELVLKFVTACLACLLFFMPGLSTFIAIQLFCAFASSLFWLRRLYQKHKARPNADLGNIQLSFHALKDFSLWQHLSGLTTLVIYSIDPWVLNWFHTDKDTIAIYTLALKISSLFFAIPMFIQNMTTIFLVNGNTWEEKHAIFKKNIQMNAGISLVQFLFFLAAGRWLGHFFRGTSLNNDRFYSFGLILCAGVLAINLVRPIISDLILHAPIRNLLLTVYVPAAAFSLCMYTALTYTWGATGCAIASALAYAFFALLLLWKCRQHGVASSRYPKLGSVRM